LVQQFIGIHIADDIVFLSFVQLAGQPQDIGLKFAAQEQHAGQNPHQYQQNGGITLHPGGKLELGLLGDLLFTGITDQPPGFSDTVHDMVAFIDAGRAVDTFQLRAVADIDAGRTDVHTLETVDAVPMAQGIPILVLSEGFSALLPFSPLVVIGHYNGFIVQQYPLQPTIGACNDTDLFPEPGKYKIEYPGEDQKGDHGPHMGEGAVHDVGDQGIAADQIGQEHIGDKKGNDKENRPFQKLFPDLLPIPWRTVQTHLCPPVPLDPIFDPAEDHFHKNGLWADPATEDPAKSDRKEGEQYNAQEHGECHQIKILRPKGQAKDIEAPLQDAEQHKLASTNLDKGRQKQQGQDRITHVLPIPVEPPTGLFGIHPGPFPILGNGSYTVPKTLFHAILFQS